MQAMNSLDHAPAGAGHGAGRRGPARARSRDLPGPALRPAHGRRADRPHAARRRRRRRSASARSSSGWSARLADRGLVLRAAFENEFSLATMVDGAYVPVDSALCFSTIGMTAVAGLRRRAGGGARGAADPARAVLRRARARPAGDLDRPRPRPAGGRRAAAGPRDDPRRGHPARAGRLAGAQAVARERRQRLPHPLLAVGGRRRNRFYDGSREDHLSDTARSFIAGVLEHLPGLCALTAPSFNSYHRIVPQFWAGAFRCWGHDNREAPVRVASPFRGAEEASTNAELKASDASCNPYLAFGGLIAAGLDGLERGLEPPEPVEVDPATLSDAERAARGVDRMPGHPGRGTRRARRRWAAARRARRGAGRLLHGRAALGVGGLLRGRPGIRAAGSLREVLNETPAVDHHAHGILRAPPASLDEFRGLFSESTDPRQWPHVATGVTYRRAIAVLASHLGCEPDEEAVYARRLATDPARVRVVVAARHRTPSCCWSTRASRRPTSARARTSWASWPAARRGR